MCKWNRLFPLLSRFCSQLLVPPSKSHKNAKVTSLLFFKGVYIMFQTQLGSYIYKYLKFNFTWWYVGFLGFCTSSCCRKNFAGYFHCHASTSALFHYIVLDALVPTPTVLYWRLMSGWIIPRVVNICLSGKTRIHTYLYMHIAENI